MVLALAFAMLVVGLAIALVVDRLWLDAARVELTRRGRGGRPRGRRPGGRRRGC